MKRLATFALCAALAHGGLLESLQNAAGKYLQKSASTNSHSSNKIEQRALHDALELGIKNAVQSLGRKDGFYKNPLVKIPLPSHIRTVAKTLRSVGLGSYVDNFERSMNRAAEEAVPQTASILLDTARNMSAQDAKRLLFSDEEDAITQYFKQRAGSKLARKIAPIIKKHLESEQVTKYYRLMMEAYNRYVPSNPYAAAALGALGMNTPQKIDEQDLSSYVTNRTLEGLFAMIAQKERTIRSNPYARTTRALRSVFGE